VVPVKHFLVRSESKPAQFAGRTWGPGCDLFTTSRYEVTGNPSHRALA